MFVSATSGAVTRMTAWADSQYGVESGWKILWERSVAVPHLSLQTIDVVVFIVTAQRILTYKTYIHCKISSRMDSINVLVSENT